VTDASPTLTFYINADGMTSETPTPLGLRVEMAPPAALELTEKLVGWLGDVLPDDDLCPFCRQPEAIGNHEH
jgi:hypothetical protein